jgi:hypothetical protein
MTGERERELLVELAVGAWRPRRAGGGIASHPAWADLDAAGRTEAFRVASLQRKLEAALDQQGLSTTAKAVLARIREP